MGTVSSTKQYNILCLRLATMSHIWMWQQCFLQIQCKKALATITQFKNEIYGGANVFFFRLEFSLDKQS